MIWMQSREGRAIDLLDPRVADVDFTEIAHSLALLNRYAGASAIPVSVALHTLIAADAAVPEVRPWVLLHDAHEARIGDILAPTQRAIVELVALASGAFVATLTDEAFATLRMRHDRVIHAAAGLPMPDAAQIREIARVDRVALVTERRDFLAAPPRAWGREIEAVPPLPGDYTELAFAIPALIAGRLRDAFRAHLPALAATPDTLGAFA